MQNKAQSALEYMMTYGWAVLIIVIVAVVLYSMGIFSPSSAVARTTTGFSPFSSSATLCNSTGLTAKFGVLLSNSYDIAEIRSFTAKFEVGMNSTAAVTEKDIGNFTNGDIFAVRLPISCLSGITFSASGYMNYTVSTPAGKTNYTATGTLAGTGSS